ncbi:hypothetical protein K491DRAFT_688626 [Lophiostoma macrostomum CBS 122681]|uniref:Pentatricopeptide repeat protein n=1 Tax=Lophiostoma macrostomum CBS 122681 TaxID=1314788 RepID=A0A6A6TJF6_9PLEO|nr:hypothetical protein K491DRAFT_688626 [Lophiostoma macrostomum CBS 122681]
MQQRASFVSVQRATGRPENASQDSGPPDQTRPPTQRTAYPADRANDGLHDQWGGSRPGRYSRFTPRQETDETGQSSALVDGAEDDGRPPDVGFRPREESDVLSIRRNCSPGNLQQAWNDFLKTYPSADCRPLLEPRLSDLNLLTGGKVFMLMLNDITKELCKGAPVPVTPTEVLFRYEQLGLREKFARFNLEDLDRDGERTPRMSLGAMWWGTFQILTDGLVTQLAEPSPQSQRVDLVLGELLSVWKLFFQLNGSQKGSLKEIEDKWSLPSPDTLELSMNTSAASLDLPKRLQFYHPRSLGSPVHGFSAVIIFNLLKDNSPLAATISDALRAHGAPFMELLVHVFPGAKMSTIFKHLDVSRYLRDLSDDFRNKIADLIKFTPSDALAIIGPQNLAQSTTTSTSPDTAPPATATEIDVPDEMPTTPKREGAKPSGPGDPAAQEEFMLKRIERAATETTKLAGVEALWVNAVRTYTTNQATQIPLVIYNAFLTSYLQLFAADRTVEVWNHMIRHNLQPTVTTWTAMLTGCVKARDKDGLNATWKRMIQARVQPDVYAWTTRIHGLISLKFVNEGFAAMDEMGKQWLAADRASQSLKKGARKTKINNVPNTFPKPTIEVVNGAASAFNDLANMSFDQRSTLIRKVLQWASNFAIQPNAQTYNILIQLHMSANDYATVFKLTRQMKREGIEGDIATYTMLMRASLSNIASLAPAEQKERVMSLLQDFENMGLKLNAYTYGSTIDQLLRQPVPNFNAVQAVVAHMQARDLVPSPHIYTSLIMHYFQESPPNIEAVDALWARIISTRGTPIDQKLFERLIEGYAQVDEVGKMMAILNRMGKKGMVPAWNALTAVLECLVRAEDWERVDSLMMDVQQGKGVAKGGVLGGRNGEDYFLRRARAMGLMRVPGEEQAPVREELGQQPLIRRVQNSGKRVREQDVVEQNAQYEEQVPQEQWAREDENGENGSVGGVPL